ncbi:MAG TPA: MFS transporter, partial [Acidimicrobiales bacterium]|nr:MFS transporter [Acidimicrobiales bacterium]
MAVAFVANGLGGPSFLARLPERQSDLGLSDATLGLTLVGMALGAMAASPVAGGLVSRVGSRPVLLVAAGGLGASLWMVGAAPNAPTLFAALTVVGATDAAMDISMNAN